MYCFIASCLVEKSLSHKVCKLKITRVGLLSKAQPFFIAGKELIQDYAPFPDVYRPHFSGLPYRQIYLFHYRIVGREGQFVLGVLLDLSVQIIDQVGRAPQF